MTKSFQERWELADAIVSIFADTIDGIEDLRMRTENRLRDLVAKKGGAGTPEEAMLSGLVDAFKTLDKKATLDLQRVFRKHPLAPWAKQQVGLGEKQVARLVGAVGNPYLASKAKPDGTIYIEPRRGPAELWAYCGYHVLHPGQNRFDAQAADAGVDPLGPDQTFRDTQTSFVGAEPSDTASQADGENHRTFAGGVAPRKIRGQKVNWNGKARMRVHLVAESCIKQAHSPYRPVYDQGRGKYADAVHSHPCFRCGPRGNPAPAGSPLSLGHQHARALRLVAKAILRDLYLEARRLHIESGEWS